MPSEADRLDEIQQGNYADKEVASAKVHSGAERQRASEISLYVEMVRRAAPTGKWLDIGCGTGTLIGLAQKNGIECEGIELNADRRTIAKQQTHVVIHDRPLEHLDLPTGSFAAVSMINVFSHLLSPTETFNEIHRILKPGGVLLLYTGEVGPGVKKHHSYSWSLGDHLHWLGLNTIETYAEKCGYIVVSRDRKWNPDIDLSRERLAIKGTSASRNAIKTAVITVPGTLPILRWYMTRIRHRDNPAHTATILLTRP